MDEPIEIEASNPIRHGFVGKFLEAVAPWTEATDIGVLAHLIPCLGTILGPSCYVFAGNKQPPRINSVLVGPTNLGRKGTACGLVDKLMKESCPEFWKRQRLTGLSSGEGLIDQLVEEGLDRRLHIVEPEFSRVLTNTNRTGNILSHVVREAYDSGDLAVLTVNARKAHGGHVSIVGHITQKELEDNLVSTDVSNGFANRFLWLTTASEKVIPLPKPLPSSLLVPFKSRIKALVQLGSHDKEFVVELDDEAESLWLEIYPSLRENCESVLGCVTARSPSLVLRIALIYCLTNRWHYNDDKLKISRQELEAAMGVWKIAQKSSEIIFGTTGRDRMSEKILKMLEGGPLNKTEINSAFSSNKKTVITRTLNELIEEGAVASEKLKTEGRGRPPIYYELASKAS